MYEIQNDKIVFTNIDELLGQTLTAVENINDEIIRFTLDNGTQYEFFHDQDCCERVTVEDIAGDLQDLVGAPLLVAEVVESRENPLDYNPIKNYPQEDSYTWTFYKFSTIKGSVTIRWYGESNGYYSESVSLKKVE